MEQNIVLLQGDMSNNQNKCSSYMVIPSQDDEVIIFFWLCK
jgi:hypothetical protein